jgi:hypothetical protein
LIQKNNPNATFSALVEHGENITPFCISDRKDYDIVYLSASDSSIEISGNSIPRKQVVGHKYLSIHQ